MSVTVIRGGLVRSKELEEGTAVRGGEAMAGQLARKSKDLGKNLHRRGINIVLQNINNGSSLL
jgi:hypothetical protein